MGVYSNAANRVAQISVIASCAGIAQAAPSSDLFEYSSLGNADMSSTAHTLFITDPGFGGEYGVAARRIAIGEAGVKEHVSTLNIKSLL